ncbi:bifunctional sugar phosphate isomerase/epimerase/4-hydroxyphenylpyruvate dioxygenase family protein [Arthrobacter castelli]|uniref:bifunctional sugar phosphate isomerase/epimerase/4-hydroxyphenylpyruvate dioxygenase family protein n=1 Tax=Arthrobacter castelli TaxID=271431 RepID=UPI00041EC8FB|nr:sugar phosphate isomerase/epimerase and 4-hydroxyphenylpyruvate domain-containing protein [Arthrobacter castelli]
MRTSIATVCLSGTLEEKMRACAEAGFDGIEIFEQDLVVCPKSPDEIRTLASELGLSLDLYQPFRDFEGVTEEELQANLHRAEAKFRLMRTLGIDMILVCSNAGTASIDDDDVAAAQLHRLGILANQYGIRIAYEALAWGRFVNDFEHACRIVEQVDLPNVGTCLDSFHILSRKWDPAGIEDIPAGKIFFVQLADAPTMSMDILSWSRHHRLFPGEGDFELAKFMGHLVRAGYAGPVSLEIFNDVFRQSDEVRTAVDGMRSLVWLEELTSLHLQELDQQGDPQSASYPMQLATLPQVDQPSGFNFTEIRAENTDHIQELLYQLGFVYEGRHRTKDVQLWTQGQTRVIVNEQDAQSQEPFIAALGFDVENPQAAASRAIQLCADAVPRRTQANEEVLQAVSAPDSTEIFLCQATPDGTSAWTSEFSLSPELPDTTTVTVDDAANLITQVDHVNLAQPWQVFDEAVLFYESTLSLQRQPSTDVPSPIGLVRSQVMRTSGGDIRLALNVAPQALEQAGMPVSSYPAHVAFSCTDLIAVARKALARGLKFLPIPANYYADLQARFRLDPSLLRTLQDYNLLYDRDDNGDFLHFYTATVGSVFFEVVERRNGYEGYGAPNAPVRLAAQYQRPDQ